MIWNLFHVKLVMFAPHRVFTGLLGDYTFLGWYYVQCERMFELP